MKVTQLFATAVAKAGDVSTEGMQVEPLLKVEEAADLLRVSRWTVYRLIKEKRLVSVKVCSGRRVPVESVEAYVASLIEDVR